MGKNFALALGGFCTLVVSAALISNGLDQVAEAAQQEDVAAPVEGAFQTHTVRPSETLYRISELYYGDPSYWQLIADFNSIDAPNALQAGATINIPDLPQEQVVKASVTPMPEQGPLQEQDSLIGQGVMDMLEVPSGKPGVALFAVVSQVEAGFSLRFIETSPEQEQVVAEEVFDAEAQGFRFLFALDSDNDGEKEVYTVWHRGDDPYYTRVYKRGEGRTPTLLEVVPNDSFAMAWEASQNGASPLESVDLSAEQSTQLPE